MPHTHRNYTKKKHEALPLIDLITPPTCIFVHIIALNGEWTLYESNPRKKNLIIICFCLLFCFFLYIKSDLVSDKMEEKKETCLHVKTTAPRRTNIMLLKKFHKAVTVIQWFSLSWASLFSEKKNVFSTNKDWVFRL